MAYEDKLTLPARSFSTFSQERALAWLYYAPQPEARAISPTSFTICRVLMFFYQDRILATLQILYSISASLRVFHPLFNHYYRYSIFVGTYTYNLRGFYIFNTTKYNCNLIKLIARRIEETPNQYNLSRRWKSPLKNCCFRNLIIRRYQIEITPLLKSSKLLSFQYERDYCKILGSFIL